MVTVIQQLLDASLSELTTKAYQKSITMFHQFSHSELHLTCWFPATTTAIVSFIAFYFQKGYAPSSITSVISAISYVHKMHNLADPTATFVVHKLLHGATKLRTSFDQRTPITKSILHQLVHSTPHISDYYYHNVLTAAMYSLAFHAFLRIGEIAVTSTAQQGQVLQVSQLTVTSSGCNVVFLCIQALRRPTSDFSYSSPYRITMLSSSGYARLFGSQRPVSRPSFYFSRRSSSYQIVLRYSVEKISHLGWPIPFMLQGS